MPHLIQHLAALPVKTAAVIKVDCVNECKSIELEYIGEYHRNRSFLHG